MKKLNKFLLVVGLCLIIQLSFVLAACGHTHSAVEKWSCDATSHWHACEDTKCDEKLNKADHATTGEWQSNATQHWKVCDTCGFEMYAAVHTYDQEVQADEYLKEQNDLKIVYYKSCVCGLKGTETFEVNKQHEHTAEVAWQTSDTQHWHNCTGNGCTEKIGLANHEANGVWQSSATDHWQNCTQCDYILMQSGHEYDQEVVADKYFKQENGEKLVYYKSCICGQQGTDTFEVDKTQATITNLSVVPAEIVSGASYNVMYDTNSDASSDAYQDNKISVQYKQKGADDSTYSSTQPKSVGEYTVRVSIETTRYYTSVSATCDFEIKVCEVKNVNAEFPYNGLAKHTMQLDDIASGLEIEVTFKETVAGADFQSARLLYYGQPTTDFELDYYSFTTNIVPKEIELEWTAPANLTYDGNEKTAPTVEVVASGLIGDDTCTVTAIEFTSATGSNVWFGETFTYTATSLSNTNYKLPANASMEFTVEDLDEATVGTTIIELSSHNQAVHYFKITLEEGKSYYFDFEPDNIGHELRFELYKKFDATTLIHSAEVVWGEGSSYSFNGSAFTITETGVYYVKYWGLSTEPGADDYGDFTMMEDTHTTVTELGHCTRCGLYLGKTEGINGWLTVDFTKGTTQYFRFAMTDGQKYNIDFLGSSEFTWTAYTVSFPLAGDYMHPSYDTISLTKDAQIFSTWTYIYLVVTQSDASSVTFQLEETNPS